MRFEREINIYADNAILKRFQSNETSLSIVQGKIEAMISESELVELQNSQQTMYSKLMSLDLTVSNLSLSFSDLTTKYDTVSDQYTEMDSKLAEYKAGVDGLSAEISNVQQNLTNNYSTTLQMQAAIQASVDGLSSTISKNYVTNSELENYSTTEQMQSAIDQKANEITTSVSQTYVTNTELDATKSDLLESAQGYADDAEAAANANISNLLKSYSTTTEMNSAINQKADQITSTVSQTYATKESVTETAQDTLDAANQNVTEQLKNYVTSTQMESAIDQKADEITSTVSKTYATLENVSDAKDEAISSANSNTANQLKNYSTTAQMNSAMSQKANEITTTVSNTYVTKTTYEDLEETIDSQFSTVSSQYTQLADKFSWVVAQGTSSSNFTLTSRVAELVAEQINLHGLVTFSGLGSDVKDNIQNSIDEAVSGVVDVDVNVGGRNLIRNSTGMLGTKCWTESASSTLTVSSDSAWPTYHGTALQLTNLSTTTSKGIYSYRFPLKKSTKYIISGYIYLESQAKGITISLRESKNITQLGEGSASDSPYQSQTLLNYSTKGEWYHFEHEFTTGDQSVSGTIYIAHIGSNTSAGVTILNYIRIGSIKLEEGTTTTDWTPAPEDIESDISDVASSANAAQETADNVSDIITTNKPNWDIGYTWTTTYGDRMNALESMVKTWTDDAVSDTTQINGGWIKTNTITADKIAIGDFTNYVIDGTFERGLYDPSDTQYFRIVDNIRHSGTHSLRLLPGVGVLNSTYALNDYKIFPISAGDQLYVEWWGYRANANGDATITVTVVDAEGSFISSSTSGSTTMPATAENETWIKYSYVVTANVDGFCLIKFTYSSVLTTLTGSWYIDDVSVRKMMTGAMIVSGTITADKIDVLSLEAISANIAGWNISGNRLLNDQTNFQVRLSAPTVYGSPGNGNADVLRIQDKTNNTYPFVLTSDGTVQATKCSISGGTIGGWTITETEIYCDTGENSCGLAKYGTSLAFWAGATYANRNNAKFRVSHNGETIIDEFFHYSPTGWSTSQGTVHFQVGNWQIKSTYDYHGYDVVTYWDTPDTQENGICAHGPWVVWGGWNGGASTDVANYKFVVTDQGVCKAMSWVTGSRAEWKENIVPYSKSAVQEIMNSDVYYYDLKDQGQSDWQEGRHIGFVIGDQYNVSSDILDGSGGSIDMYSALAIVYKAIQEQQAEIAELKKKINQQRKQKGKKYENCKRNLT